jgi:hypothetical protein
VVKLFLAENDLELNVKDEYGRTPQKSPGRTL